jgi:D-glycero-alpha-D-manno-heptose 1-phosphate guanylyltransferase
MRPKEAIILAGGKGTRLQSVVSDIPKPMALIGDIPFLEYLLNYLESYQIEHAILSVGYKWEIIKEYFGDKFKTIRISYAVEEEALGTGGGIKLAMEKADGDHLYVLNGDTFFDVNLHDLSEFYFAHQSDMAITVKRKTDFFRYGTVLLDVCKVIGFQEKQALRSGLINGGVYMMRKGLFEAYKMPDKFSLETDLMEKHLDSLKICAMRCSEYFIDIGIPVDYEKAKTDLPQKISL